MTTSTPAPVRLLIVDDDEQLRQALVQRFTRLGMAVTPAASGEEALSQAGRQRYDVALLDLNPSTCWAS
jgi:DNA-binding response OmpR family regulator